MTIGQLLFSFKGRINRQVFWIYAICAAIFMLILGALANSSDATAPIVVPLFLLLLYTDFTVCAKRLHDTNRSGWCQLVAIIPIIGAIYLLIVCGFFKGTEGDNNYGPPSPKEISFGDNDEKQN